MKSLEYDPERINVVNEKGFEFGCFSQIRYKFNTDYVVFWRRYEFISLNQ